MIKNCDWHNDQWRTKKKKKKSNIKYRIEYYLALKIEFHTYTSGCESRIVEARLEYQLYTIRRILKEW